MNKGRVQKHRNKTFLRKKMRSLSSVLRNNQNLSEKICCPFDAAHIVDRSYIEKHIINCASRENLYHCQKPSRTKKELGTVSLEELNDSPVPQMENWDEECIGTYNPIENTQNRAVLRCLMGASKSMKKRFKLIERERMRILESVVYNHFPVGRNTGSEDDKPLRKYSKEVIQEVIAQTKLLQIQDVSSENIEKLRILKAHDIDLILLFNNLSVSNESNDTAKMRSTMDLLENVLPEKLKKLLLCSPRK